MKSPWNTVLVFALLVMTLVAVSYASTLERKKMTTRSKSAAVPAPAPTAEHVVKTDAEWQKQLTPEQYRVLRRKGTEIAFTGKYFDTHTKGTYLCAACGYELFSSQQKFDSGTGWPSFWQPSIARHVHRESDSNPGMFGVEVTCARCGGHLGHVFNDGPAPTGLRYCINSVALTLVPAK